MKVSSLGPAVAKSSNESLRDEPLRKSVCYGRSDRLSGLAPSRVTPSNAGFSVIELLVVFAVIAVMSAIAVFALNNVTKYATDSEARKIIDLLDEARQKSLNQRTVFRFEINKTKNRIVLIDENSSATTSDDVVVKSVPISSEVVIGTKPSNVPANPTATSPIPVLAYQASNYPLSSGDQKITLRFRRNGQVMDAGSDGMGTGAVVTGATIFLYSARQGPTSPTDIRALTVLGTTGDTAVMTCKFDANKQCIAWSKF